MFPRSPDQVGEVIPDSQPASSSGGNMGGKQGIHINNVADILKQLSFEEKEKDTEKDDEEEDNRFDKIGINDSDDHESDVTVDDPVYYDGSQLPQSQAPYESFTIDEEPTTIDTNTLTISSQTPETETVQLMGEVQHCDQAPPIQIGTSKIQKPSLAARSVQKGQSRSSSRLAKALQVDDTISLPSLTPIPLIDTTEDVPPPKPKRATRGQAATTKGKKRAL